MRKMTQSNIKRRRQERIKELFSMAPEQSWQQWSAKATGRQLASRLLLCAVLYAAVWAVFALDHPHALAARTAIVRSLTEHADFSAAAEWYNSRFAGWPALLPSLGGTGKHGQQDEFVVPAAGSVLSPFSAARGGIWLSAGPDQAVAAIGPGLVESVKFESNTGLTVVVRHAGGMRSIYGWLETASVEVNDWLQSGGRIGKARADQDSGEAKLFFAIYTSEGFVDPQDVIPLD